MTLYHYTNPASTHQYQEATERQKTLAGVMQTPRKILCKRCREMRNAQTSVDGVCHYCRRTK